MFRSKLTYLAALVAPFTYAQGQSEAQVPDTSNIEQITILGAQSVAKKPGSATYISSETLTNYAITDITRVLAASPGVYVTEEDGYGLRPNIGMRGNSADRSEKITVMEDGVLAAPAPYASPAAYYFPTIGRMSSIEILKGASSVLYGPRTSGGVINLTSTPIPETSLTKIDIAAGSDAFRKAHVMTGGYGGNLGGVAEVYHYAADGFKDLPNGQDTGFEKTDVMLKGAYEFGHQHDHALLVKAKYSEETSDETYLGLSEQDYATQPFSRYGASAKDQMTTEHKHLSVQYQYDISANATFNVIGYYNNFHRNWYKADKVNGLSLGAGGEEAASMFDSLVAQNQAVTPLEVRIKANNRDYLSQGIQSQLSIALADHNVLLGLRIHNDEMDRYQWVDHYAVDENYLFSAISAGIPGTDSNRIDSANAISAFINDEWQLDALTITAGLRYEKVNLKRADWGTQDPLRTQAPANRYNEVSAVLPSLGLTYQFNDSIILLAGVQKSFAPPAPGNQNAEKEQGWNYEAGMRYNASKMRAELIGFYTKLDNLHGNCTASQGCDIELLDNQYNAGAVTIKGIEASLGYSFSITDAINMPLNVSFTHAEAEFDESFTSELDAWGSVEAGDSLPYLPEQTWQIETGIEGNGWHLLAVLRHVGETRTVAGQGAPSPAQTIESRTITDISLNYELTPNQRVYAVVDNLFDETYVATKQHGGIQVGKPRSLQVGYEYTF